MPEILDRATENYKMDKDFWSDVYRKARDDMYFISDAEDAQWNRNDRVNRENDKRPCLTIDQLGQFIHNVANNIRMNTPTIDIIPGTDGAIETAEIFKGLIKNIEYRSSADVAYDYAALSSIRCSIGFIYVDHGYINDLGFEQELKIERCVNPLQTWIDCNSINVDGSDARRGIRIENISAQAFKKKYPGKDPVSFGDEDSRVAKDDDFINIAEYFEIVEESKEIGQTLDGQIQEVQEGIEYAVTRKIKKSKVMRYILSGKDVLTQSTFPGKYIPIVPVYGEEAWIDGKRQIYSLIRKSKDAQRMFNYWKSLETELLMKQPNAPILAGEGQTEDYKDDWLNPQKAMVLRYKMIDADGNSLPAPQRLAPPTIPTGIVNASRATVDDIKSTMGLYNASIGQVSNEISGIAINRRKEEGYVTTYHFGDNLVKSITHLGRILVNAIPQVIDTPRIIQILGLEGEPKQVGVNGAMTADQDIAHDLRKGEYSVRVITGATNVTKRQEAAEFYSEIIQKQPDLMQVAGDLLFKNMDISGAQEMSERMKKIINPKFLEDDQQSDPEKEQLKAQIQEGQMVMQQMQAEMAAMQKKLEDKQGELAIKAQGEQNKAGAEQGKLEIEMLRLQQESEKYQQEYAFKMAALEIKKRELDIKEADLIISAQQTNKQMEINGQEESVVVTG